MKKVIGVISIILCASMLFAGGSSEATPAVENKVQSSGPIEITFLSNSAKPYDAAIPAIIAEFEKQNPDIKVNIEMLPTKNIFEVVEVKLGSGEKTPDVLFVDAPLVMEMPFDSSVIIKFTPPELSVAMQFKVTEKNDVETSDAVSPVGASVSVSVEEL